MMDSPEYTEYRPKHDPYNWVIIEYNGHEGFACDWQDCIEQMMFIDGYDHSETYISYDDPKLTHWESIMCKNATIR